MLLSRKDGNPFFFTNCLMHRQNMSRGSNMNSMKWTDELNKPPVLQCETGLGYCMEDPHLLELRIRVANSSFIHSIEYPLWFDRSNAERGENIETKMGHHPRICE